MAKIISLTGKTWTGKLVDPKPARRYRNGTVSFKFVLETPVQGHIYETYYVDNPVKNIIEIPAKTHLSKALSAHHGVKDKGVRIALTSEQVETIAEAVKSIYAEYQAEQEQITITGWHWALGGDSHRVLIFPDQDKDTEDIEKIKDFASNTFRFGDRIRPISHAIDRDVPGLYFTGSWYSISHEALMAVIAEITAEKEAAKQKRDQEEQAKFDAALTKAKETGEPEILSSRMVECNDPSEECDMDTLITYVHPDGTTSTRRFHTW